MRVHFHWDTLSGPGTCPSNTVPDTGSHPLHHSPLHPPPHRHTVIWMLSPIDSSMLIHSSPGTTILLSLLNLQESVTCRINQTPHRLNASLLPMLFLPSWWTPIWNSQFTNLWIPKTWLSKPCFSRAEAPWLTGLPEIESYHTLDWDKVYIFA